MTVLACKRDSLDNRWKCLSLVVIFILSRWSVPKLERIPWVCSFHQRQTLHRLTRQSGQKYLKNDQKYINWLALHHHYWLDIQFGPPSLHGFMTCVSTYMYMCELFGTCLTYYPHCPLYIEVCRADQKDTGYRSLWCNGNPKDLHLEIRVYCL